MEVFKDFETANEASKRIVKENPGRIVFIMNRNGNYAVVVGWDGRDIALKDGGKFS